MSLHVLTELFNDDEIEKTGDDQLLGNHADHIIFPKSEEEIVRILRMANEHSLQVIPIGGGTKKGLGGAEANGDILLSLKEMKGIVENSVGDMIVTVLPGTTIKEISDALAKTNQMIPLDPFWPANATVGGVIAANDSGPKRFRYGSARDHVIGLRIVYPDGRVIRTGGKVVKNVAGYDMNKLFIGSMGTLGVISEITMKLRPLPKYQSLIILTFHDSNRLRECIVKLLDSHMEPVSIEVISPALHRRLNQTSGIGLAVAFEDVEKAVRYQEEWVQTNLPIYSEIDIKREAEAIQWWSAFAAIPPNQGYSEQSPQFEIALKVGSKNIDVIEILEFAHHHGEQQQIQVEAHGGAGHGISRVYVYGNMAQLSQYIQNFRSFVAEKGGYVIIQHAPVALRQEVNVWGDQPVYHSILNGIKLAIDPNEILNHKRFVGGM